MVAQEFNLMMMVMEFTIPMIYVLQRLQVKEFHLPVVQ